MADRQHGRMPRRLNVLLRLWKRQLLRLAGRLPAEESTVEPIDYSAPSIPYYTNLSHRFGLASLILYLVLFVFVVSALVSNRDLITYSNLYYLVKDINAASLTAQERANTLEYPSSQSSPAFASYRGGLVVAGSTEVTVLNASGKRTLSSPVSYGTPAVAASDKYFLTYGRGQNTFALFNAFSKIYSEDTRFPIYGAAIADDGSFVILTRSQTYASELLFYNRKREQIAAYHLRGYATSLALSPSGATAMVLSTDSEEGVWTTKISVIQIGSHMTERSVETIVIPQAFGGVCGFTDETRMAAVLTDRLLILRPSGEILSEIPFDGLSPALCAISNNRVAVLSEHTDHIRAHTLQVFDRNGDTVYTQDLTWSETPTAMTFGGFHLYIRTASTLWQLSPDGQTCLTAPLNRDVLSVLANEDDLLLCGVAYASWMSPSEFSAP